MSGTYALVHHHTLGSVNSTLFDASDSHYLRVDQLHQDGTEVIGKGSSFLINNIHRQVKDIEFYPSLEGSRIAPCRDTAEENPQRIGASDIWTGIGDRIDTQAGLSFSPSGIARKGPCQAHHYEDEKAKALMLLSGLLFDRNGLRMNGSTIIWGMQCRNGLYDERTKSFQEEGYEFCQVELLHKSVHGSTCATREQLVFIKVPNVNLGVSSAFVTRQDIKYFWPQILDLYKYAKCDGGDDLLFSTQYGDISSDDDDASGWHTWTVEARLEHVKNAHSTICDENGTFDFGLFEEWLACWKDDDIRVVLGELCSYWEEHIGDLKKKEDADIDARRIQSFTAALGYIEERILDITHELEMAALCFADEAKETLAASKEGKTKVVAQLRYAKRGREKLAAAHRVQMLEDEIVRTENEMRAAQAKEANDARVAKLMEFRKTKAKRRETLVASSPPKLPKRPVPKSRILKSQPLEVDDMDIDSGEETETPRRQQEREDFGFFVSVIRKDRKPLPENLLKKKGGVGGQSLALRNTGNSQAGADGGARGPNMYELPAKVKMNVFEMLRNAVEVMDGEENEVPNYVAGGEIGDGEVKHEAVEEGGVLQSIEQADGDVEMGDGEERVSHVEVANVVEPVVKRMTLD